jgi:sugar phosphate permease
MFEKRKQHLIAAAQPHLEAGETVREVMVGQTFVSPLVYLLIAPVVFVFMVRPRIAMATDQHVYMFEGNMWSTKKLNGVLQKFPIGQAPITLTGLSITIGNETSYALLFQFTPMKQIAALAQAGAPPQMAAAATG